MPSLDFDWEQGLFRGLRALWRAVAPVGAPAFDPTKAATLIGLEERLRVFGSVLAGEPIRVGAARACGGVRGADLLLPKAIELADDPEVNAGLYLLRVAVNATMRRQGAQGHSDPVINFCRTLDAVADAVALLDDEMGRFGEAWAEACALELSRRPPLAGFVGRALMQETLRQALLRGERPWTAHGLREILDVAPVRGPASPPVVLWGRLVPVDHDPAKLGEGEGAEDGEVPAADASEADAQPVEELRVLSLDEDDAIQLPSHVFEKVETAEEFNGTMRQLDGADDLDDQLEALEEVNLADLMRGGPRADAVLKADVALDADVPDVGSEAPDERFILYDEWDGRRRQYRPGWCRVLPTALPLGSGDWAAESASRQRKTIDLLVRRLSNHRAARELHTRQRDGEEIDLAQMVRAWSTVKAGRTPDPRLYIRRQPARREVATTVLLDVSLSTDSWVDDRRVLDVARDATLVLGEVADRLGDALQVLSFASQTRNRVRVWTVRDWNESWAVGRRRLGLLEPQGYTRIGGAIRHAVAGLRAVDAKERLLLLISDGKPTDYDRYEGRYGVADVRQAIREASGSGVHVHALAVDAVARDWLPAMMGPGAWHVLRHPDQLAEAVTTVYGRLT